MKTYTPISEIYQQLITRCWNAEERQLVFDFIRESNLSDFIDDSIAQIEEIVQDVQSSNHLKIDKVTTIAYTFLKAFNGQLSKMVNLESKELLKTLLVKIKKAITSEIQQKAPSYATQIHLAVDHGLGQALFVEGYDKEDFERYIQLDYTDISNAKVEIATIPKATEYLVWNDKKANLDLFVAVLISDYRCIKSKGELVSLFAYPPKKDSVRWDKEQTDLLLLLFNRLYDEGFIQLKGAKGRGLWKVVMRRFVDFGKVSFNIDAAKRLNKLKGEKLPKPTLVAEISKIINHIRIPTVTR